MASIKKVISTLNPQTPPTAFATPTTATHSAKATTQRPIITTPVQLHPALSPDIFSQVIETTKGVFRGSKEIASAAATQAKSDQQAGRSIIGGMRSFTKTVDDLTTLITNHAQSMGYSKAQQDALSAPEIGIIAQDFAYQSARDLLIDGASSSTGSNATLLREQNTLELILNNFGIGAPAVPPRTGISLNGKTSPSLTATAGASASGLAEGASASAQIFGALGAAYGAVQVLANWGNSDPVSSAISGFTAGAYLGGAAFGPFGAAVGGVAGGVIGIASGLFKKSGKSQDQIARDKVRTLMQNNGILNENWELSLANGARYDIGKDGKFKLDSIDGSKRRAYEVDLNNPLTAETIAMVQPLSLLITGGNKALADQFTGYFTNAALSNAKTIEEARQNALAILQSMKVSPEDLAQGIAALVKQGSLSESVGKAYLDGLSRLVDSSSDRAVAKGSSGSKKIG